MKGHIHSLLMLCAVIIATSAMSQSFQLSDTSGILPNGSDVYVSGDTSISNTLTKGLTLRNISGGDVSVIVRKIIVNSIQGSINSFCFGTNCYPSTAYTSDTVGIVSGFFTDFSGDYKPNGHTGESIIRYVFFNVYNKTDSVGITVHYNATPAGINKAVATKTEISNPYPNPAGYYTSINYNFPLSTIKAKFVLRDVLGSKVKEMNIYETEGKLTLNTSDIKEGVYFYSFIIDDKLILTKKLIVR